MTRRQACGRKREGERDAGRVAQHAAAGLLGEHAAAEPDRDAVAADDGVDDAGWADDDAVDDPGGDVRGADDAAERKPDVPDDDGRVQCGGAARRQA